ncbi:SET and MYND domain-containing protein (SMYD)-like protein [Leptotrombidium deliense]|uniref:Protein-lysine N-methyltransferase SMYD4 n=1 Tax=Leptotrombidium deliense TaxID=299467 RepID=A0A443S0J7_9ACAR|nr:SET and MYND domain-containing protein (SMYD)-like protein [Leptotrombidium deliense]
MSKKTNLEKIDLIFEDFDMFKVIAKFSTDLVKDCSKSVKNKEDCEIIENDVRTLSESLAKFLNVSSQQMRCASDAVRMNFNEEKGRVVVAKRDIEAGEVVMIERAFASWLRPSLYSSYCHHCLLPLREVFHCSDCSLAKFCSTACREDAFTKYHKIECPYLPVLMYLSSGHLALRILIISGIRSAIQMLSKEQIPLETYKNIEHSGDYNSLYSLTDNIDNKSYQMLFPDAFGAAFMTILAHKMGFVAVDDIRRVGALLLKHISQIWCNVMSISTDKIYETDNIEKTTFFTDSVEIGAGMYPTICIMNHSCDSNVVNSFSGHVATSTALVKISSGDELLVTYGPHFKCMSFKDRQRFLKKRFCFDCRCTACKEERQNLSHALLCDLCKGCLILNTIDCSSECLDCGKNENVASKLHNLEKANNCVLDYYKCIASDLNNEAFVKLSECYRILKETVFESHELLILVKQELAVMYEKRCRFSIALQFASEVMDTFKRYDGETSLSHIYSMLRYVSISLSFAENEKKGTAEAKEMFDTVVSLMKHVSKKESMLNAAKHLQVQRECEFILKRLNTS